jgi:hypothetical protein
MTLLLDSGLCTVIVISYFVSDSKTRQTSGNPVVVGPGNQSGHAPMSFTEGQSASARQSCQGQKAGENSSGTGQPISEVLRDEGPQSPDLEISHKSDITLNIAVGGRESDFVEVITTVKVAPTCL